MIAAGWVMSESHEVRVATAVLSLGLLPTGLINVAEAVFTSGGRARVIALAATTENLLRTAVPLWLLSGGYSLPAICLSLAAVRLAPCLIYAVVVRRHLAALSLARWPVMRGIAAHTPTFAGLTLLAALHWQAAGVLIGKLGGELAAAEFGVASRFLLPVALLLSSYANVIQPTAARLAIESLRDLGAFLSRGLKLAAALTLPFAVGMTLLARELLALLFGPAYVGTASALSLLAFSVVPFGLVIITARGLIAAGRQRIDLIGNAMAVTTNLALNLILIPRYGAAGAALAQLLSMMVLAAVEIGYTTQHLAQLAIWRAVASCVWPLAAMALALWQTRALGLWGAAAAGGSLYLACLWLTGFRGWRIEDRG
jgi:O-antigen/teichoic acid export membrane protein